MLLSCSPGEPTPPADIDLSFGAEVSRLEIPPARALWIDNSRAFACAGEDGLFVIDLSDPVRPAADEALALPCYDLGGETGRVNVAAGSMGLQVVHPGNLTVLGGYEGAAPFTALAVDPGEQQVWLAGSTDDSSPLRVEGVVTYSAEHLDSTKEAELDAPAPIALAYDRVGVFVATEDGGLQVLGLELDQRAVLDLPGVLRSGGLRAQDGLLWAALGEDGLALIDVTDLSAPTLVQHRAEEPVWGLAVLGDRLYLGTDEALVVLDTSQPDAAVELGRAELSGLLRPQGIYVVNGMAHIVDEADGLLVLTSVLE